MTPGILYISYDGLLEPLGQSQVLAYLEKLSADHRIHLISFEKAADWSDSERRDSLRRRTADAGISWHPLRYHKLPTVTATAFDIVAGTLLGIALTFRYRLGIVHARSYVAGLIGLAVKRATAAQLLFDMRGLWADERVDGGLWPKGGRLYRIAKAFERKLLLGADHVVTLTRASRNEVSNFPYLRVKAPPFTVIPTCADLSRFRVLGPRQTRPFVLGYVGSVGTWYLLDEMLFCFRAAQEISPGARLLIVNRGEHDLIRERARALELDSSQIELLAAQHREVPVLIARMSAGMALYKPSYSRVACAPTKLGEYLGCGVPCLSNRGVGDAAEIIEGKNVGVALDGFSADELTGGMERLIRLSGAPYIQQQCRAAAEEIFSLEVGAGAYAGIYDSLARDGR